MSGSRVLINSRMSRLAIFYHQFLQPTCGLLYLPRSRRWWHLSSTSNVQATFYFREALGVSCQS